MKPDRSNIIRRVWNASSNLSLRSGISWMTRRSSPWLTQYARPDPLANGEMMAVLPTEKLAA